jgi:hypothetical protein
MKNYLLGIVMLATSTYAADMYNPATSQHYRFYLCAQYSQLQPDRAQMTHQYYAQLFLQKAPVFTLAGYMEHLFNLQHYEAIMRLLPSVGTNFQNNKNVQVIIGQTLELMGKPYEAETIFINLYPHCKTQPDIAYYAAAAQTRRANFSDALTIIDDYINSTTQRQTHSVFYVLKSKIHQLCNQGHEAALALKKAVSVHTSN